jgi:hypothetical protein
VWKRDYIQNCLVDYCGHERIRCTYSELTVWSSEWIANRSVEISAGHLSGNVLWRCLILSRISSLGDSSCFFFIFYFLRSVKCRDRKHSPYDSQMSGTRTGTSL